MTRAEVDIALTWAGLEGWNPGKHDADSFYSADPEGFLVGLLDGEPIATLSAVRYEDSFGFLGFYIVKPQYRGQGYGLQLWNAGLKRLEGRSIGLDGVPAQQANYEKSGFQPAFRNIRHEGPGGGSSPTVSGLVDLKTLPESSLIIYDRRHFPAIRPDFIQSWIKQPGCHALGIIQASKLVASGVIRPCQQGWKIGPLFADNAKYAESLFLALRAKVPPSENIYLDTPEPNQEAVDLAEKYRMKPVFETVRMYQLRQPPLPLDRIFGITSFELG